VLDNDNFTSLLTLHGAQSSSRGPITIRDLYPPGARVFMVNENLKGEQRMWCVV
jgi:hypothetical protein